MSGEDMDPTKWICPKGHTFTLRSDFFSYLGEHLTYLDPKIRADDSPCGGCTEYMQDACVLAVAVHFEGESDE
jgi:hypothetical protein